MKTNFLVIGASQRKRPVQGDIFAYRLKSLSFSFGRVIRTDARVATVGDLLLLYFYQATSSDLDQVPVLTPDTLLCPPVVTELDGWRKGYFRTVINSPIGRTDELKAHCFAGVWDRYYDEYYRPLERRVEPCGIGGIAGIYFIDELLSRARNIPIADPL